LGTVHVSSDIHWLHYIHPIHYGSSNEYQNYYPNEYYPNHIFVTIPSCLEKNKTEGFSPMDPHQVLHCSESLEWQAKTSSGRRELLRNQGALRRRSTSGIRTFDDR
jgi:hypothetical protein